MGLSVTVAGFAPACPVWGLTTSQVTSGLTVTLNCTVPLAALTVNCWEAGFPEPICHRKGDGVAGLTLSVALVFTVRVTEIWTASKAASWAVAVMVPE